MFGNKPATKRAQAEIRMMRAFPSIAASTNGGSNGTEHYESGAQARGSGDSPYGAWCRTEEGLRQYRRLLPLERAGVDPPARLVTSSFPGRAMKARSEERRVGKGCRSWWEG